MKNLTLTFLCVITMCFFTACKKDKGSDKGTNTHAVEYYLKGTMNGTAIDWEQTDGDTEWRAGFGSSGIIDQGVFTGVLTPAISADKNSQQLGVDFRTVYLGYGQDKTAYFNSFINTGAWPYAKTEDYEVGTKNIIIQYTDGQGKQYSSIGAQTGSTLNVISVIQMPSTGLGINESLKIKLTFECTLYPGDGTGNTIKLSNIEATLHLEDVIPL